MTLTSTHRWLAVGFLAAFLVVGAMHWPIPYAEVSLPNSLVRPGLLLVVLIAAVVRVAARAGFWPATLVVGSAAPAAILARVVVDTATDPTAHNLWPFEVFLGGVVGFTCSVAGAGIAGLYARVAAKRRARAGAP